VSGVPEVGAYVVDTRSDTVGQVIGRIGPRLQLRAPGGGREWNAAPEVLRAVVARTGEELRARVTEFNRTTRMPH
jgi:hypothetical protein